MGFVLDLIVILIIALFSYLSAKKGFVCTLVEVIGFVLSIVIVFTISTPIANAVYDNMFAKSINKKISNSVTIESNDVELLVDKAWDQMPGLVTQSGYLKITKQDVIDVAHEQNVKNGEQLAEVISTSLIKPIITTFISLIIKIILFIALFFVVKILAKVINKLFSFSVVGKVNTTLGAVLGVFKGTFFAIFFCLTIGLILSFTQNGFLIFTNEAVNSSYIFKFFMGL